MTIVRHNPNDADRPFPKSTEREHVRADTASIRDDIDGALMNLDAATMSLGAMAQSRNMARIGERDRASLRDTCEKLVDLLTKGKMMVAALAIHGIEPEAMAYERLDKAAGDLETRLAMRHKRGTK